MIINANALRIPLANQSVHTVVTSPPYWGLRDYGTGRWKGGDPECDHNPQRPDGGERLIEPCRLDVVVCIATSVPSAGRYG